MLARKNAPTVRKSGRVTIAVIRGLPSYKENLKRTIQRIEEKYGISISMEGLIERGIRLALEEYGETAPTGRLQGRYAEKS